MTDRRFVFDTNTIVSAVCFPLSFGRQALELGFRNGPLLVSEETLAELLEVLTRPKFDRYIDRVDRLAFFARYRSNVHRVIVGETVRVARDPDDNMFLELAVSGKAHFLVSRDMDLLCLDPFRGVRILDSETLVREAAILRLDT